MRGLSPAISKAIDDTAIATTAASTGAATPYEFAVHAGAVPSATPASAHRSCSRRDRPGSRSPGRGRRRSGRAASRASGRTDRSAPRGRPRSTAWPGRLPGHRAGCPRSRLARRRRRRVGWAAISTRLGQHLAPDDQLLLVAAGQREARTSMLGVRTSKLRTTSSARRRQASRSISPCSVNSGSTGDRAGRSPTTASPGPSRRGGGPPGSADPAGAAGERRQLADVRSSSETVPVAETRPTMASISSA